MSGSPSTAASRARPGSVGESRWPMAIAVVVGALLRAALPNQLRDDDSRFVMLGVAVVLLALIVVWDPGRIDRDSRRLRVATDVLIAVMSLANATAAVRIIIAIIDTSPFTDNAKVLLASGGAIWLSNVVIFALWYWDLDRGGAAARARDGGTAPAFVFPEMVNPRFAEPGWYPKFVDYLHFAFGTATAFSPTDVSAVKPWSKLMMVGEEAISLVVALLVVARAVNILK